MNCPAHLGLGVVQDTHVRLKKEVRHQEAHTLYLVPKQQTQTHIAMCVREESFCTQPFTAVNEGLKFA